MSYSIEVQNISKQYKIGKLQKHTTLASAIVSAMKAPFRTLGRDLDKIWAIKDISFNVKTGEVVGLIGRNGAGKSTLLKLLTKITYPTQGKIITHGRVASLLEVGTGFHEELTGRENIMLNGSILGMRRHEIMRHMDEIIDFSGVEKFIDTPIKRYSSGMRLRLGFAVVAHLDQEILLVDEILAVGDAEFQKKCLSKMDDLNNQGRTVLFVSHNMNAVEGFCSRVLWIDNGQVKMDGATSEVIKTYLSSYAELHERERDLTEIEHRKGSGKILISGIDFLSPKGESKEYVRSGDKLTVRIHFKAETRVPTPHFGFELHTEMGTLVSEISTWACGYQIPEVEPGDGYIDLKIDFLNLMPDRYYVTLWAASVGGENYDCISKFMKLEIEAFDVYGSGKGIESRYGVVFLPGSWHYCKNSQKANIDQAIHERKEVSSSVDR